MSQLPSTSLPHVLGCFGLLQRCMTSLSQQVLLIRVESMFFGGMRGEVWIEPGKAASQVLPSDVSIQWGPSRKLGQHLEGLLNLLRRMDINDQLCWRRVVHAS